MLRCQKHWLPLFCILKSTSQTKLKQVHAQHKFVVNQTNINILCVCFFLFFVMQKVTVFRIRITLYESRFEIYFLRERLLSFKRNRVGRNSMEGMSFRCSCGKTNRFVCRRLK